MILNLRVVLLLLIVVANLSGHFWVPKNDKDQKPCHQNLHHPNPNRRTLKMVSGHVPNSGAPRLVGSSYGRIIFFQGQFTWNILKSIDSSRFVRDVYPEVFAPPKKRGNPEKVMWKHRLKFESSVFCGESLACKKTFQLGVHYILGRGNHYIYIYQDTVYLFTVIAFSTINTHTTYYIPRWKCGSWKPDIFAIFLMGKNPNFPHR